MTEKIEKEKSVGERLLALRNKSSLTQEELADRLNVSRQSISKWELNKTLPDVEKLIQLSEMYEVSIDFLIKGEKEIIEEECQNDNLERQETSESFEETEQNQIKEEEDYREIEQADSDSFERTVRQVVFVICMLLSGVLCLGMVFVTGRLFVNQVFHREAEEQDMVCVEKIYEQYTKAQVSRYSEENDVFQKKVVWLDVPGVRENDYIFCYLDKDKPLKFFFEYYPKTLLLPMIAGIIFLIFFIVFWMELKNLTNRNLGSWRRGYKREREDGKKEQ